MIRKYIAVTVTEGGWSESVSFGILCWLVIIYDSNYFTSLMETEKYYILVFYNSNYELKILFTHDDLCD